MTDQDWHVGTDIWRAYVAGTLNPAAEASVEAHVMSCAACRGVARTQVAPGTVEVVWHRVHASVTAPKVPLAVRWLRRLGVPEDELVLLGAADAVLLPWATAVGAALAVALISGLASADDFSYYDVLFLALAPLVPVLAVVAAFDATESLREVSAATPYSKLRLTLIRATIALAVAVPVTMAIGLLVPGLESLAFAWLLPSLGLTASALVLLTWMAPRVAAGLVTGAWLLFAAGAGGTGRLDLITTVTPQVLFGCTGVALVAVLAVRTSTWTLLGGDS
jgi:hypothetical protein